MKEDISKILNEWPYDAEKKYRILKCKDSREILQVRKPMGIEQYEMDGRPDGEKPFGKKSVLQEYQYRLKKYKIKNESNKGFKISHEDFILLQYEAIIFYYRYLILFQLSDFERTIRDTEHNLKICDFTDKYVFDIEDRQQVLQYKPYILRINGISRAMLCLKYGLNSLAKSIIKSSIEDIRQLPIVNTNIFELEKARSLNYLESILKEVLSEKVDNIESLKKELKKAVEQEDYEKAAELRDRIKEIDGES